VRLFYSEHNLELEMIGMSVGKIIIEERMTIFRPNREDNQ